LAGAEIPPTNDAVPIIQIGFGQLNWHFAGKLEKALYRGGRRGICSGSQTNGIKQVRPVEF
jgi:hypothetical protein